MGLADTFQQILDSLPDDWSHLDLDLRIFDEDRYIEAASYLTLVYPQPYSKHDWHWRIMVAHRYGHAAAAPPTRAALKMLDDAGIAGELAVRGSRVGRSEVRQLWGRPESVRQELRRIRGF